MKSYSWKTRASCGQPTSGLHFQFEFHITVLRYMGRVSVKQLLIATLKICVSFCAQYIFFIQMYWGFLGFFSFFLLRYQLNITLKKAIQEQESKCFPLEF